MNPTREFSVHPTFRTVSLDKKCSSLPESANPRFRESLHPTLTGGSPLSQLDLHPSVVVYRCRCCLHAKSLPHHDSPLMASTPFTNGGQPHGLTRTSARSKYKESVRYLHDVVTPRRQHIVNFVRFDTLCCFCCVPAREDQLNLYRVVEGAVERGAPLWTEPNWRNIGVEVRPRCFCVWCARWCECRRC